MRSASHSIQSMAASSSQATPEQAATSRYRCSPRASGALALAKNAVDTAAGSSARYSTVPLAGTRAFLTAPQAPVLETPVLGAAVPRAVVVRAAVPRAAVPRAAVPRAAVPRAPVVRASVAPVLPVPVPGAP